MRGLFFFFWVLLLPVNIFAEVVHSTYFESAAAKLKVPVAWTRAIAEVESGNDAFALNIEGKSYHFATKEEALQAAENARKSGSSFDTGVMQVNNQWLEQLNIPLSAALDPAANIWLGSWILSEEIRRHGQNWMAVGHYHSPTEDRANRYVELVKQALKKQHSKTKKKEAREVRQEDIIPPTAVSIVVYRGQKSQARQVKKIDFSVLENKE